MQHLALIMDGNRRWAKKHGLMPWQGHQEGLKSLEHVVAFCLEKKIPYLSLYAFSIENFKRSERELQYLFEIIAQQFAKTYTSQLITQGVRVRFVGDRALFPRQLVQVIEEIEMQTSRGDKLGLNMLFCYGAQQEIVHGVKNMVQKINTGVLSPEDISVQTFADCLWTAGIPAPDLMIRTGGARRLSNFLLFSLAYSELLFLDCYWPEITQAHLQQAVDDFAMRTRNIGV